MNKNPLATICVTTYNSEKTIKKTLKSILDQDYPNFKIIVSDNNSTDQTEQIVKSFQSSKVFFRKNILKKSFGRDCVGGYESCNNCLRANLVKGEFAGFYHADDIYKKDIVKKEVEFLIKNPGVGAVFTLGNKINQNDEIIGEFKLPKELRGKNIYNFRQMSNAILNNGNTFLITPTFMARKNIFKKIGLFKEYEFGTSADLEMWLRILEKYPIGILNENLINYRTGGAGKRYQHLCTEKAEFFKVMDYYLESKSLASKVDKKSLRQYEYQKRFNDTLRAMNLLIKGEEKKAKALISKKPSFDIFRAFFENLNIIKIKEAILRLVLVIGINLKLDKYLGKILYKLRYK